jgi:hypothetical protein
MYLRFMRKCCFWDTQHENFKLALLPLYPSHQNRCIGELSFRSEVKAVRLRRDRVVVALVNKVYVYNFADLSLLDHIDTAENAKG